MTELSTIEPTSPASTSSPARADRRWVGPVATFASIILAFLIGAIVMVLADPDVSGKFAYFFARPGDALSASWDKVSGAYGALLRGSVGSLSALADTTFHAAPLICAGLGVGLAFRAGLFNIGAQGQAILGAIASAFVGFSVKGLPLAVHLPLAILAGLVAGAAWGFIPGLLKAKFGAHEVIVTIMMNSIAVLLLSFVLNQEAFQVPGSINTISPPVEWTATFPRVSGSSLHAGFFVALIAAAVAWWVLERSTLGFRLRAVGLNPSAAKTAGMHVSSLTMAAMAMAGAFAGLAGTQLALGPTVLTGLPPQLSAGFVATVGFDAITVALLGRSRPFGIVLAGLLFGALHAGGLTMAAQAQTPSDLVSLIQALIVLFVAAPGVVMSLLPWLKERRGVSRTKAVAA